jgi:anti-sigma B factor antagonist
LIVGGRIIDGVESARLQEHADATLAECPFIVLDLAEVEFIDSCGLGLLVRLLSHVRAAGGDLKLCSAPNRIGEILRITRLLTVFDVHESEDAAVTAFYQHARAANTADRLVSDILCVDWSSDVLAYVGALLRQAGYGVMTSTNLPDALMLLKAAQPTLVVISANCAAKVPGRQMPSTSSPMHARWSVASGLRSTRSWRGHGLAFDRVRAAFASARS